MPKWVWYVVAAVAAWFLFLRNLVSATGGANLAVTAGNNTPQTGYSGYPPGWQPPGAPSPTYSIPYPITVGNPTGQSGTSVAQDIGSILSGLGTAAGGLLGSGGLSGLINGSSSKDSSTPPTWVNPWGIG